jgi:hypothetical protein
MERERLKFCIDRFDHYYDSVNNKGAVFLGLSTFIVGGLSAAYPSFLSSVNCNVWVHFLMRSLIFIGLAIMIIVIRALTPFISNNTGSVNTGSVFYFGSIGNQDKNVFLEKSKNLDEEGELIDLRTQAHELSKGLTYKFRQLRMVAVLFTIQFVLFIPLIILLINNLKPTTK